MVFSAQCPKCESLQYPDCIQVAIYPYLIGRLSKRKHVCDIIFSVLIINYYKSEKALTFSKDEKTL